MLFLLVIGGSIIDNGNYATDNFMNISLFDRVSCTGSESSISQCTLVPSDPSCTPYCSTNLGLRCYDNTIPSNQCSPEGSLRLADGVIDNEGRVEVCVNGVWGSVCDQGFDKTDAHVVCQQLGHPELGNNNNNKYNGLLLLLLFQSPISSQTLHLVLVSSQ